MPDSDVLNQWVEDGPGEKIIGLLVAGRERPLRGEWFEYVEIDERGIWIVTGRDGSHLVLKASSVIGIELTAAGVEEGG